jgi:hypothetical protein
MVRPRLSRLAHAVLALLLALAAVSPTAPGALARTAAESVPDADDDCETEFVAPVSVRQSSAPERLAPLFASAARPLARGERPHPRAARGAPVRSADPLGARLRC